MLGAEPLTAIQYAAPTTYRQAGLAARHYVTARDATLSAHPWNFAIKRVQLLAYCEPNVTLSLSATCGTCVTFTVSCGTFSDLDVGKTIEPDTTVSGHFTGLATLTMNTCGTQMVGDIDTTFSTDGPIGCGNWRLFNAAPAFDYTRSVAYPTDSLRMWRTELDSDYQVEGATVVCREDSINFRYIKQVTDISVFTPTFVRALVCHLAALLSQSIQGHEAKYDRCWAMYEQTLKKARTTDGMEGTPEQIRNRELTSVRYEGGGGFWRWR